MPPAEWDADAGVAWLDGGEGVAVVGGGPAGLMAAETLAQAGRRVTVFERMPSPGRKFLLAGRGGLNLTHTEGLEEFVGRYGEASDWMAAMVRAFPPEALRAWAAGLGQATFVGSSGRVFPVGMKATPLLRAWLRRLAAAGVALRTGHCWTGWAGDALRFETAAGERLVQAGAVVLALGGASWPRLGSDGGWTALVPSAPLRPANCGFLAAWSAVFAGRFAGAPLKRIGLRLGDVAVRGEAVLTAGGMEGGAVYALSALIREAIGREGEAVVEVDLRPDLDRAALVGRMGGPAVSTANALRRAGLDAAAAGLVREVRDGRPLADQVKAARVRLVGVAGMARAISTAGGVRFGDLDGVMLRARPGVFVAGEMLDWEAPTGGYLLQGCFATGRAAGEQALAWLGG